MGFVEDLTGSDLYAIPSSEPPKQRINLFGTAVAGLTHQMSQRITMQEHAILAARNQYLMQEQEHKYQDARQYLNDDDCIGSEYIMSDDERARRYTQAERILESIREPTDFSKSVNSPSGF